MVYGSKGERRRCGATTQSRQGPGSVFPHQCFRIIQQALQEGNKGGVPRIAHGDTDIP